MRARVSGYVCTRAEPQYSWSGQRQASPQEGALSFVFSALKTMSFSMAAFQSDLRFMVFSLPN